MVYVLDNCDSFIIIIAMWHLLVGRHHVQVNVKVTSEIYMWKEAVVIYYQLVYYLNYCTTGERQIQTSD